MGKWEVGKRAQRCGIREPAATVRQPAGAVTESFSEELLELSESAARRRLGAQHGVGARPESVRPPRRRPPATRRQRQLTADADAVGHATERTFQEALENVSVAYFPMLFFGRSAASPYSLAETASRPRPPSAVRPPPGPSGAALPRLFQTANRRRKARLCARGALKGPLAVAVDAVAQAARFCARLKTHPRLHARGKQLQLQLQLAQLVSLRAGFI